MAPRWFKQDAFGPGSIWSLFGVASNDVWATGLGTNVFHWDGSTWSSVPKGTGSAHCIWGTATDNIWMGGVSGSSEMFWNWDGVSWTPDTGFADIRAETIVGMWGSASNNIWAVASAGTIYRNDSGLGGWFNFVNTPFGPIVTPSEGMYSIFGVSPTDIWIGGEYGFVYHGYSGPGTGDGGSGWTRSVLPGTSTESTFGIFGFAANDMWAAGGRATKAAGGVTIFHWNGAAWTLIYANAGIGDAKGCWGTSSSDMWFACSDGTILHWNGSSMSVYTTFGGTGLLGMWGFSATDIWLGAVDTNAAIYRFNFTDIVLTRRPKTFFRPKPFRFLKRGVSNFLTEKSAVFGGVRQSPEYEWGVSVVFTDAYASMGQGQFLDKRAVVAGGVKVVNGTDVEITSNDAWVFNANGDGVTALPAFPNNGGAAIRSATLGDGRILFCGGASGIKTRTLHPGTLLWTSQPDMVGDAVDAYTLVTRANGNVLRIGGVDSFSASTTSVEEFNQGSNTWSLKAPMAHARAGCAAVLLADGRVLVTNGGFSTAEIYDPGSNTWAPTANNPQAGNRAFTLVTTDAGETYAADSNGSFTLYIDSFNLTTNSFTPLATKSGSFQSVSSSPGSQLLFDIGGGFLAMVLKGYFPRVSFYDIKTNSWFEGAENYPEPLQATDCIFHLNGGTFLGFGGRGISNPMIVPHRVGHYAILSTFKKNDGAKPTFAGLVSVQAGKKAGRVYLSWNPGSDAKTHVEDLNYYVYWANVSGEQDFSSPYATTQAWAGSKGIELVGLAPNTDYYFVVRARDMCVFESFEGENPSQLNLDTNVVEVLFHTPVTPAAPSWNWTAAPAMSQARRNLQGVKIGWGPVNPSGDVSRFLVFGGTTDPPGDPTYGDIYSLNGKNIEPTTNVINSLLGTAVVDSDVFINDSENRYGAIVGGSIGGFSRLTSTQRWNPYTFGPGGLDLFFSFNHNLTPDMNEAVEGHAVSGVLVNDLLRTGGETNVGVTNTVERLFYRNCQRVQITAQTSPFTVGATLTGLTSGTTGIIRSINPFGAFGPELLVSDVVGGFWVFGEEVTDSSGGDAFTSAFSSGPVYFQEWKFVAPMTHARRDHSSIELADGRILVVGGVDATLTPVTDIEIYDPSSNTWALIPGAQNHETKPVLLRLQTDEILIIGGDSNFGGGSFVDLVDAAGTGVSAVANLPGSRKRHTAHVFADGKVGVFGGEVDGTPSRDVRLYNPSSNTWSHPVGADMTTKRAGHVSFMLPNNAVLVVGGEDDTFTALASAEISGP